MGAPLLVHDETMQLSILNFKWSRAPCRTCGLSTALLFLFPSSMPTAAPAAPPSLLRLRFAPAVKMTDEQFFQFCQQNRDLRIERTAHGEIIIMSPTSGETGARNADLPPQLTNWSKQQGGGLTLDSSTGFALPNGADRAPDAAWVRRERLAALR